MKITVEVSDFYLDSENGDDLEASLKDYVKKEVLNQIYKTIEKKVEEQITRRVKEEVEQKLTRFINKTIEDLIANESLVMSGKTIPIAEYIKNQFVSNSGWGSPTETLKKLATQYGAELKARYDLQFASHVVAKLNEQGMLKADIAKMLTETKS